MKKNVSTTLMTASLATVIGLGGAALVNPITALAVGPEDVPTFEELNDPIQLELDRLSSKYPEFSVLIDLYYDRFGEVPDVNSAQFKEFVIAYYGEMPTVKPAEDKTSLTDDYVIVGERIVPNKRKIDPEVKKAIDEARAELENYASAKVEEAKETGLFNEEELGRIKRNLSDVYTSPFSFHLSPDKYDEPEIEITLESVAKDKKDHKSAIDDIAEDWIISKKEEIKLEKELGPLHYPKLKRIHFLNDLSELDKDIMSSDILPSKDKQEYATKTKKIREQAIADIKKADTEEQIESIYGNAYESLWSLHNHYNKIMQPVYEGKYIPKFDEFYAGISKPMTPEEYKKIIETANGIVDGTVKIPANIPVAPGLGGDSSFDIAVRMTPYAEARLAEYGRPNIAEVSEVEKSSNIYQSDFAAWSRGKYKKAIAEYKKAHAVANSNNAVDSNESTQNTSDSKKSYEPKHMKKSATPETADVTAGVAAYLLGGLGLGLVSRKKK